MFLRPLVSVTWMRPASLDAQTGEQFTTTLTCKVYEEANLTTALSDGVGVVKVRQISSNAAELVDQATKSLIEQGAGAIVLDLRDKPADTSPRPSISRACS